MMAQLQKMQQQLAEAQARLAEETVTATAGGGAIKVVMTGDQKCQSVEINPELLKDADAEMLQDLVLSAVNMALDQSRELAAQRLGPLAVLRVLNESGHSRNCHFTLLEHIHLDCGRRSHLSNHKTNKEKITYAFT
jgi:DNA-binding YbaB/EbfC family protein